MQEYDASTVPTKVKENELFYTAKITMTKAHMRYLQFHIFKSSCDKQVFKDARIKTQLDLIGKIYCLSELLDADGGATVYDTGFFAPGSLRLL